MNKFLKKSKKLLQLKDLCVVLCNESCDLDSAVSSITLAYHLHLNKKYNQIIPVINVQRNQLPLKTEVIWFFNKYQIDLNDLICFDEFNEKNVKEFILVDHHVSKYHEKVVMVFDHRPFDDKNSNLPIDCLIKIEQIGSCCSLLMNYMKTFESFNLNDYEIIMRLLYGPIILDTVNFSKEADRARPLDYEMIDFIEKTLNIQNPILYREELFKSLVKSRGDISSLTPYQILLKDLKIEKNKTNSEIISCPGFPMLVENFIKKTNVEDDLRKFAKETNSDVILLIGLQVNNENNQVSRDIGIINIKNNELFQKMCDTLLKSKEFDFNELFDKNLMNGRFFHQNNIKLSRKQIIPIIKLILN